MYTEFDFQTKIVNELIAVSSYREVKNIIDSSLTKLREQDISEHQMSKIVDDILQELKRISQTKLPYDQYANIITAQIYLKKAIENVKHS